MLGLQINIGPNSLDFFFFGVTLMHANIKNEDVQDECYKFFLVKIAEKKKKEKRKMLWVQFGII